MTALMGNTQLLAYFADKRERSAVAIQAIGVATNYAVLFQVRASTAWRGVQPSRLLSTAPLSVLSSPLCEYVRCFRHFSCNLVGDKRQQR